MKRMILIIMIIPLLLSGVFCNASDIDIYEEQYRIFEVDELISQVPDSARDIEFGEALDLNAGLSDIFEKLKRDFGKIFTGGLRSVLSIVAVSIICGSVTTLSPPAEGKTVKMVSSLIGALAVLAIASDDITGIIGMGSSFINEIAVFSRTLLPTVAATEAACGMFGSAVVRANIALMFSDILMFMIKNVFLPLTYIGIFAAVADATSENNSLKKIFDVSSSVAAFLLKAFLGIYISYISVAGIVSSGADQSGVKAVKLAIGGVIPVVGPVIAESAETVLSGALIMKNLVGVFGLLVILSAFVTPFLTLILNYFLFKFAAVCVSPLIGGNIALLTERLAKSFGLILGMCAASATVIFVAIISAMRSVTFI